MLSQAASMPAKKQTSSFLGVVWVLPETKVPFGLTITVSEKVPPVSMNILYLSWGAIFSSFNWLCEQPILLAFIRR
jgi:hypothetical protein